MLATTDTAQGARPAQGAFDPSDVRALPPLARRFLLRNVRPGTPSGAAVELESTGDLRLGGRWLPFRARQVLVPGRGFVWQARVGRFPASVTGADSYDRGRGRVNFRLWGVVPVARGSGPDVDRSAAGRFAAETVVWAPHALAPSSGATWTAAGDAEVVVSVPVGDNAVPVTLRLDPDGRLEELSLQRWGNPDGRPFAWYPFGGSVEETRAFDGVTIAAAGQVGWWWGTADVADSAFFRYRIVRAHLVPAGAAILEGFAR